MTLDPSLLVPPDASLRDVVETMTKNSRQVAAVVDDAQRLVGLVTDGDIRRALLRGATLAEPVARVMNTKPVTAPPAITRAEALAVMHTKVIRHLPLVDRDGRLVGLLVQDPAVLHLRQGILDKRPVVQALVEKHEIAAAEACYAGDDLGDLEAMMYVGLPVAVGDARPESSASHATSRGGGAGRTPCARCAT